jgi:arsenite methyltransferase
MEATGATVDVRELETKVKDMYRHVAQEPDGKYHFELGRALAEHLGYPGEVLDRIPDGAIESFAGVGYFFDLANLSEGERVIDLGSGSGMDVFFAADRVGPDGAVIGVDFTAEQLTKARGLAEDAGHSQVEFREGRIEQLTAVFAEAARVLKPGGRLAIADIISERQMKESTVCDADLWASCIGGAAQGDVYRQAIEGAGLRIEELRENPYEFISDRARDASAKYGVKSISLVAQKS